MLAARVGRLERTARPLLERTDRRARIAAVLADPLVRPLVERVEAAYDAEPEENRVGEWRWRLRVQQPPVWLAWFVVSQIIAERLGDPPRPVGIVLPERLAAAAALRREAGLGEMPPEWRP